MREQVFGLRTVRQYKLYRRGAVYFAGCLGVEMMRRVRLANKAAAEALAPLPESEFAERVEFELQRAKRARSVDYYEMRHRR